MVSITNILERVAAIDIVNHHGQCEMNFHLFMAVVPGCRDGRTHWKYLVAKNNVDIHLLDSAPYTSTIEITQAPADKGFYYTPKMMVRLYHDVEMAEVIAWDNHKHWLPVYSYPNTKMYQTDEKLALNRFLGEWLIHFRQLADYVGSHDAGEQQKNWPEAMAEWNNMRGGKENSLSNLTNEVDPASKKV